MDTISSCSGVESNEQSYITPRQSREQRPTLLRKLICTLRRMRIGNAERKKSEMAEMT